MIGEPRFDLEIGVYGTPLPIPNALEENALVLGQGGDARLRKAGAAAVLFGERDELGAVVHGRDNADISPRGQRISIRKTLSAELRHIIRMNRYQALLDLIAARRAELNNMSERAACEAAGLKPDAIRTIRRGNAPKPDTLVKLASALRMPASVLLDAAANIAAPSETASAGLDDNLDQQFRTLLSQMDDSTKLKAIEIMEILLRPDGE